jgi:acyl carrier protein
MSEPIEVLRKLIAKQANIDPSIIKPDSTLDELGVTSLDLVEIIFGVEDEYGVSIPLDATEAWKTIKTVGDIMALGESLGIKGA